MRFMLNISMSIEAGNASAKEDGFKALQRVLEQQKPEAAYFAVQDGKRTGILILNLEDPSQLPVVAEPWFLAFNAAVEATPVMPAEHLLKAGPAIEQAVKTYG
jgi:hypothetical protein